MKSFLPTRLLLLTGFALFGGTVDAVPVPVQSPLGAQPLPLQLSDAFDRAWSKNVEVQRAELAVQASKLTVRAREAAFYMPRLDLGMQAGRQRSLGYGALAATLPLDVTAILNGQPVDRATLLDIFNGVKVPPLGIIFYQNGVPTTLAALISAQTPTSDLDSSTSTSYANSSQVGVNLSLGYSVYSGGSDKRAIESAKLQQNLAEIELVAVKRKVALDGIAAYVNLRQATQQAEQDQATLLREQGRRDAKTQAFHAGALAQNDALRADLDYELQRIKAEKSAAQRAQTRQAYCDLVHEFNCVAPTHWPEPEAMPDALKNIAQQWQASLIKKNDANRAIQSLAVAEAESAYLPRVSVSASMNMSGASNSSIQQSLNQFRYRGWQMGVSLSWNLFDGLQSTIGIASAELAQKSAEADLAVQVTSSRKEQAGRDRQVAALAQQEAKINVRLARLKLDEAQTKERLGRATNDELQSTEQAFQVAELALQFQEWERRRAAWSEALLPCNTAGLAQIGCTDTSNLLSR